MEASFDPDDRSGAIGAWSGLGGVGDDVGVIHFDDQVGVGHAFALGEFQAALKSLKLASPGATALPGFSLGEAERGKKGLQLRVLVVAGGHNQAMK